MFVQRELIVPFGKLFLFSPISLLKMCMSALRNVQQAWSLSSTLEQELYSLWTAWELL